MGFRLKLLRLEPITSIYRGRRGITKWHMISHLRVFINLEVKIEYLNTIIIGPYLPNRNDWERVEGAVKKFSPLSTGK